MSKQAYKRVRRALKLEANRQPLPEFAWPGGYPMFYVLPDISTGSGVCVWCPKCANENIESIDAEMKEFARGNGRAARRGSDTFIGVDANYEDAFLTCEHCSQFIDPAYLDEDELKAARSAEVV